MKDNKIIAEFMGANPFRETINEDVQSYEMYGVLEAIYLTRISSQQFWLPEEMQFHASWDWLMQVVNQCYTSNMQHPNDDITQGLIDVDIEATYKAVVEFIKEYNKTYER